MSLLDFCINFSPHWLSLLFKSERRIWTFPGLQRHAGKRFTENTQDNRDFTQLIAHQVCFRAIVREEEKDPATNNDRYCQVIKYSLSVHFASDGQGLKARKRTENGHSRSR